jgi:hypothetical protein
MQSMFHRGEKSEYLLKTMAEPRTYMVLLLSQDSQDTSTLISSGEKLSCDDILKVCNMNEVDPHCPSTYIAANNYIGYAFNYFNKNKAS